MFVFIDSVYDRDFQFTELIPLWRGIVQLGENLPGGIFHEESRPHGGIFEYFKIQNTIVIIKL